MKPIQISFFLLFVSFLFSCSTSRNIPPSYVSAEYNGEQQDKFVNRKILYSAELCLVVKNPDSANAAVKSVAKKYGGYVNEESTQYSTIRVKSENLNDAIADLSLLGKLTYKNILGQDVTEDYTDYQIRLANAEKARDKYLELLARAENVEAALQVEKELERINEVIDTLKGKINRVNHLSDYSTITVRLREKKKPGIVGYVAIGVYHTVKWFFVRN